MSRNQIPSQIRTPGIETVVHEAVRGERERELTIIEREHDITIIFGGTADERTLTFCDLLALQVALSRKLGTVRNFSVCAGSFTLNVSAEF